MGKLYKYVGPAAVAKVFSEPGECRFKCSYPKDFNDPYELFLTVDYDQEPEVLAYYKEVIGEIPQLPTTCFSTAPNVTPMWAHYAQNFEGIVIEVDEAKLEAAFPAYSFGDVDYKDQADEGLTTLLGHAYATCKPRHTEWLQMGVFSAAYYTKRSCWSYEQERRLVATKEDVIDAAGGMLVSVPYDCITALIVGPNATREIAKLAAEQAGAIGCRCFEIHIGKSTPQPYFVDTDGKAHVFDHEIVKCEFSCDECGEPVQADRDECPWCAVRQDHALKAAQRNPMRILARLGMLKGYYESAQRIRRNARKVK